MRRLIIHIGRQKSGTSALQYLLHNNNSILKKEGIIYPVSGRDGKIAHHQIALLMKDENFSELKLILEQIVEESKTFQTVIISSEAFQNVINFYSIQQLTRHFDQVSVICYLRESLSYLLSAYKQRVQAQNYTEPIEKFLKSAKLNYKKLINRWSQLDEQIIIRLYEKKSLINQNIIDDFFHSVNLRLPEPLWNMKITRNTSLSSNLILYKIIRNKLNLSERREYQILENIARDAAIERSELYVSRSMQQQFRAHDKNNAYLKSLFGTIDEKDFSTNPPWLVNDKLKSDFEKFNEYFGMPVPLDEALRIAGEFIG